MIVIVLGMHRSGTSAMAGLLHSNEIIMGRDEDFYPPPMKENPKGFYENVRFRRINDKILAINDYRVKSFSPKIPNIADINPVMKNRMASLIDDYSLDYHNWGWKDPRTSLTLRSWYSVFRHIGILQQVKLIIMIRDANEIRNSMLARGNKEQYENQFLDLVSEYYIKINRSLEDCELKFVKIFFRDLFESRDSVLSILSNFLQVPITDWSFIDSSLRRQGGK